jgi:hypothetical protein
VYSALLDDSNANPAEAAAETVAAIKKDGALGAPSDGWASFETRLAQLLSEKSLGISAKAGDVAMQTSRHVHGLRVLTDARPIFGENAKDGPRAFAILHTLQIEYYEDGQNREWFISLDADDVDNLRNISERAIAKESSLRASLERSDLPVLSWRLSSDDN